ncbi:MAG: hypothetical protein AUJ52_04070 [Elusimicrobia bacterium CG1_02_63_36]|nr:MAG: hypothetical protein AUJ52_04070 [Elusimicrobia bacterium CG1_02_63_36]PIP83487.1 MAG: hypothetical protein COR54_09395 [Elusimicrobia bacterium CG22_combo_CG10-13_8_21_14_all_63_91]PJA12333.1 MAG: hypothetical protein COX66_17830 [Elusimicrobia bacterium CG_4_10_14_0_2_um_filter_63_34]PJB24715.1 MAG: hypothetical protein CO113_12305 [Elusimicrobia bacterium CG_4_9_14_3_um_filter_62_55]
MTPAGASARRWLSAGLFAAAFSLYLCSRAPGLVPYRDTGEMALAAHSLGVAHPPSYPLYAVAGRLFDAFAFGDSPSRLSLLSALSAAAAVAGVGFAAAGIWGPAAALFAAPLLATNATLWSVATVQEMYALTVLFAVLLFALGMRLRETGSTKGWYGACLLFGLFLGNRTDLLLWAPGLIVLGLPRDWKRSLPLAAAFGLLGLAIYLYLPLRSAQGPWLDWNHPAALSNFWGSLTRRGYGATLDLLSKNYRMGELFLPNLKVYALHAWNSFGLLGLAAVLFGAGTAWKVDRRRAAGGLLLWGFSGPLFLFLANMPPNPHALAIVEPHYLLSDVVLVFFAAEGAAAALAISGLKPPAVVLGSLAVLAAVVQPVFAGRFVEMNRRWNLFLYDFQGNALRSTPKDGILIAKKDVQLFSLWSAQRVLGRRPDIRLVAQGIAHSPWYRASQARDGSPLQLGPLRSAEDFHRFFAANPGPVFATPDAEIPIELEPLGVRGAAVALSSAGLREPDPSPFLVHRGDYRYEKRPDFFTADLTASLASVRQRRGAAAVAAGDLPLAERELLAAWSMKRNSPQVAAFLGFAYFQANDLKRARDAYLLSTRLFDETLALAEEYRSLPDLKDNLRKGAADASLNLGVCLEKLGDRSEAERLYRRAIAFNPRYARAYFNIAVLYWKSNPARAVIELEAALRADANFVDAQKYLAIARARMQAR